MSKVPIFLESKAPSKKGKIAVILTSYGRDIMLKRAIVSVLEQTYKDFLLLIIDDNSPQINEKTQEIISTYAKQDKRIHYFRTETTPRERRAVSTFCRNINFMLDYAKTLPVEYICYLPCDDYFYPKRLEKAVNYLDGSKVNLVWNPIHLRNERNNVIGRVPGQTTHNSIYNTVAVLDHQCITHRLKIIEKLSKPYWSLNKQTEAGAPDGQFFNRLTHCSGAAHSIGTECLGSKTLHRQSIQGRTR